MALIHYRSCPVCASEQISFCLRAKDHTVSGASFDIWQCTDCTLRFTQDVPDQQSSSTYYKAESYISHTDTREGFVNNLYHKVRTRTLRSKLNLVRSKTGKQSGRILDVGAGTGAFAALMQSENWTVVGLEPDPEVRVRAMTLNRVALKDSDELFRLTGTVDAITLWHVLEHVHQLHDYIARFRQLLASDGKLFIAVPNYTAYDARFYAEVWAAYDVPRHLYHFSPESVRRLISQHGLEVQDIRPMWYDSFYISMLSEQYKNGKGNLPAAAIRGAMSNLLAVGQAENCSSVIYCIGHK